MIIKSSYIDVMNISKKILLSIENTCVCILGYNKENQQHKYFFRNTKFYMKHP